MNRRNIDRLLAAAAAAGWDARYWSSPSRTMTFKRGAERMYLDVSHRGAITSGHVLVEDCPGHFRSIKGKGKAEQAEQILAAGIVAA